MKFCKQKFIAKLKEELYSIYNIKLIGLFLVEKILYNEISQNFCYTRYVTKIPIFWNSLSDKKRFYKVGTSPIKNIEINFEQPKRCFINWRRSPKINLLLEINRRSNKAQYCTNCWECQDNWKCRRCFRWLHRVPAGGYWSCSSPELVSVDLWMVEEGDWRFHQQSGSLWKERIL